jgi:hypothetical protein
VSAIERPDKGLTSVEFREADSAPAILAWSERALPFEASTIPENDPMLEARYTAAVEAFPAESLVFVDWDSLCPYYYVAHIQRQRSDLAFVETKPADDQEAMAQSAVDYAFDQARMRPVYFTERRAELTAAGGEWSPARLGPTRLYRLVLP